MMPNCSFPRVKTKISPLDVFFEEGNLACVMTTKVVTSDVDDLSVLVNQVSLGPICCTEKGCGENFPDRKTFEHHYNCCHRFNCRKCAANFPSNFLLELHIEETHDPLFASRIERGINHFRCICEGCSWVFENTDDRRKHMVEVHKYPSDFRFCKLATKKKHTVKCSNKMEVETNDCTETVLSMGNASPVSNGATEDNLADQTAVSGRHTCKSVPKAISFGRGAERGFKKQRGKKFNKSAGK